MGNNSSIYSHVKFNLSKQQRVLKQKLYLGSRSQSCIEMRLTKELCPRSTIIDSSLTQMGWETTESSDSGGGS